MTHNDVRIGERLAHEVHSAVLSEDRLEASTQLLPLHFGKPNVSFKILRRLFPEKRNRHHKRQNIVHRFGNLRGRSGELEEGDEDHIYLDFLYAVVACDVCSSREISDDGLRLSQILPINLELLMVRAQDCGRRLTIGSCRNGSWYSAKFTK
jgi:hypothetical protein